MKHCLPVQDDLSALASPVPPASERQTGPIWRLGPRPDGLPGRLPRGRCAGATPATAAHDVTGGPWALPGFPAMW